MKLYLDLCCFNRPFDDQSQLLVRLQTEAKLAIQESIRNGDHALVWSGILDLENADNPDSARKSAIAEWIAGAQASHEQCREQIIGLTEWVNAVTKRGNDDDSQ